MISVLPLVSRPSLLVLLHLSVLLLLLLLLVAVVSAETEVVAVPSTRTTTTSSSAATVATRGARPYYRSVLEVIDAYNLTAFRTAMERADFDLDRFFVSQQNLNSYKEDVSVTLFVPSNAAFDAIEDTILRRRVYGYNDSDHDHEEYWRDLVQYHVIEGKVWTSNEFIQGEQRLVRMVNDESVLVHKTTTANRNGDSYKFTVNGAHVLESNILAENGVVFIIDQVVSYSFVL